MKTFKKLRKRFLSGALALLLAVQLLAPYAYADEINSFSEQGDELAVENLIENEISENDGTDEEGAENSSTGSDNVIGEDDSNAAAEDDVNDESEDEISQTDENIDTDETESENELENDETEEVTDELLPEDPEDLSEGEILPEEIEDLDEVVCLDDVDSLGEGEEPAEYESVYFGSYYRQSVGSPLDTMLDELDTDGDGKVSYCGDYYTLVSRTWYCDVPIKWRVLDSGGGQTLLLSEEALEVRQFSDSLSATSRYSNSDIREYLNGIFYRSYFSDDEKEEIITTYVDNSYESLDDVMTEDKIFLPSVDELKMYLPNAIDRCCPVGNLNTSRVTYGSLRNDSYVAYWTRTNANFAYYLRPAFVTTAGAISYGGNIYSSVRMGIRPAMNVVSNNEYLRSEITLDSILTTNETIRIYAGNAKVLRKKAFYETIPIYYDGEVAWSSSRPGVATVDDNGKVTGISNGTATIFAKIDDKVATFKVEVYGGEDTIENISQKGRIIPNGYCCIIPYEKYTDNEIENATIFMDSQELEDGLIEINGKTIVKITIKADGYYDRSFLLDLRKVEGAKYCAMTPLSDSLSVISAVAKIPSKDKEYSLLEQNMNIGYVDSVDMSKCVTDTLSIDIETVGDVKKYILLQKDNLNRDIVLAENTDGKFSFDAITENKETAEKYVTIVTNVFQATLPTYIRIIDSDGKMHEEKLGIKSSRNLLTKDYSEKKGKVKIDGKKLSINIPREVPFVGGTVMSVNLSDEELPVYLEVNEDGVVKAGINLSSENDDLFNDPYLKEGLYNLTCGQKTIESTAFARRKLSKAFENIHPKTYETGLFNVKGKFLGYAEGNICDFKENMSGELKAVIVAEITVKDGYKYYFTVPVYFFVEGALSMTSSFQGKLVLKDGSINSVDFFDDISVNPKVSLTVGAGVGYDYIGSVRGSATGALDLLWKPLKDNYSKLTLSASGKLSAYAFGNEQILFQSDNYKYTIFETGNPEESQVDSLGASPLDSDDGAIIEMMDRNYLSYNGGYSGYVSEVNSLAAGITDKQIIKPAVYPATNAKVIEVNGNVYTFWIDDVYTRSAVNRSAIMYSELVDGVWSEPTQFIDEKIDNTADYDFDVATKDDEIYVCWTNAITTYEENDIDALANDTEISVAKMDVIDKKVTLIGQVTKEKGCYLLPNIWANNGKVYISYCESDFAGKVVGNSDYALFVDCYENDDLTEENKISIPEDSQILDISMGQLGDSVYVVFENDLDGDISSTGDRELQAVKLTDYSVINITNNSIADCNPVFNGKGELYWISENGIEKLSSIGNEYVTISKEINCSLQNEFEVVNNHGSDYIFYENADENDAYSLNIYCIEQINDESYSVPVVAKKIGGSIPASFSGICYNNSSLLVGVEGDVLSDGTYLLDLVSYDVDNLMGIELVDAIYDENDVTPGEPLIMDLRVKNTGLQTIDSVLVCIDDEVKQTISGISILPGEEQDITFSGFSVEEGISGINQYSLRVCGQNSSCYDIKTLEIGFTDLEITSELRYSNDKSWADIEISNNSNIPTSGLLEIHKGDVNGEVIFEKEIDECTKGKNICLTAPIDYLSNNEVRYYATVSAAKDECVLGNNIQFIYAGYGSGMDHVDNEEDKPYISSISMDSSYKYMLVGRKDKLSVSFSGTGYLRPEDLTWDTSNIGVVSVDSEGQIRANRPGTAEITCSYGDLKTSCTVSVMDNSSSSQISILFDTQSGELIEPLTNINPGTKQKLPIPKDTSKIVFEGWYTSPEGGNRIDDDFVFYKSMTLYAHWFDVKQGFWIKDIGDYVYTGKAIKPQIEVYCEDKLLKNGTDYSLVYQRNTNVNDASVEKTAPTIVVTGKGNYAGKESITFKILPKDLADSDIIASEMSVKANGKLQKPVPTLTFGGKKLTNKKDYSLEYYQYSYYSVSGEPLDGITEPGNYIIRVKGMGNFCGERDVSIRLTSYQKFVNKLSVSKIPDQQYYGYSITPYFDVKDGKTTLRRYIDYDVEYSNNDAIGKAKATIIGKGDYCGTKTVQFNIVGTKLAGVIVEGIPTTATVYNGVPIEPHVYVYFRTTTPYYSYYTFLAEGTDYEVSYANNDKPGTASVIFTGIGRYTGTIKKTFKIVSKAFDSESFSVFCPDEVEYSKGGAKPKVNVTFRYYDSDSNLVEKELVEGVDYSVKYANNQAITTDGTTKMPSVTVSGKGKYKGSIVKNFTIVKKNMDSSNITIKANDKVASTKNGGWISTPVLTDADGKKLSVGKDYCKELRYFIVNDDGTESEVTDCTKQMTVSSGTTVRVMAEACENGPYLGNISTTYRVVKNDIGKIKVSVLPKSYTGKPIILDKSDIMSGKECLDESCYFIDESTYVNNVSKGKATVIIRGVGEYGGEKKITFTIGTKSIVWWWRNLLQ